MSNSESHADRCYIVWTAVGELVLAILSSSAAKLIGKRLGSIAAGAWMPGYGDVRTLGGLANLDHRSVEQLVANNKRKKFRLGRRVYYKLDSFLDVKE